jgi:hypothetical protein
MNGEERIKDFVENKFDRNKPLPPDLYALQQSIKADMANEVDCQTLDKGYQQNLDESDLNDEFHILDGEHFYRSEINNIEDEYDWECRSEEFKSVYGEVDERK